MSKNNFVEELRWRGMLHDIMPGTDDLLNSEMTSAYIGFDPTSDSLHIGSLAPIMMLKHFQLAGHKPVVLVGGATGMIGDPSGKSEERNLLDESTLNKNQEGIKLQLSKFLNFDSGEANDAEMVNNYDWMKDFSFLSFIRDIGKHITVNYMMSKDSVKKRLGKESDEQDAEGMSFTEFSYQLVQGYDFLHLFENNNCKLQMGGSDQWGNITTGTELIRRKAGGKAYALTTPLIKKADGGKFGKTEKGNIWLDAAKTSPYAFYQFWLNVSDEDAENFIKIFTLLDKETIEKLVEAHKLEPHRRELQKTLAKELTSMVHSVEEYEIAVKASLILFGKGTYETMTELDEKTFLSIFDGVPTFELAKEKLSAGINILELLSVETSVFPSKGDLKRLMKDNGLSINQKKEKNQSAEISIADFIREKYLLVRKGKTKYFLIVLK
ncbi:MAG: tyrosine--tRNA ligase [Bacteroidales bacterium]|nr:tyrosine--tRNA ligase [Bacteroidales bacterium]